MQQHKCNCHSSAIQVKKTKTPPVNLKQQADIAEIKDDEDGVFRCHICQAFSDNPVDIRNHICHEHPKFLFVCSDAGCVKVYVTWSGLNKHKQKHSDQVEEDYPVCCLFCEQGFKSADECDEHLCPGKLNATKEAEKQDQQNGSMKPSADDPTVVKEEPQPEQKLLETKTQESSKKLITPPITPECLEVDLRNNFGKLITD